MKCYECGRHFRDEEAIVGGPRWNKRYYCSNRCYRDGEDNLDDSDIEKDNWSFGYRLKRAVIRFALSAAALFIGLLILVSVLDDSKKSEGTSTQTTTTQTTKKQSTTSTKNASSSKTTSSKNTSGKPATTSDSKTAAPESSNSQSSTNSASESSSSTPASTTAPNATTNNSSTESDESYQTYLALSTLLENEGKSIKLCEAQNQTKGNEANVIGKMSQLRGTKYYNNALKDLVRYCPKYANEYSKNGKYFASEAEFYQAYIAPDYSKQLKAKKKEKK